jgi:ATP-dependent protease, ATP-binding subunit, putative
VTDFHLDNLDAKHLTADLEDGVLVIREKGAAASEEDKQAE